MVLHPTTALAAIRSSVLKLHSSLNKSLDYTKQVRQREQWWQLDDDDDIARLLLTHEQVT